MLKDWQGWAFTISATIVIVMIVELTGLFPVWEIIFWLFNWLFGA